MIDLVVEEDEQNNNEFDQNDLGKWECDKNLDLVEEKKWDIGQRFRAGFVGTGPVK